MSASFPITIDQGAYYQANLTITDYLSVPLNITGWSGAGQIRKTATGSTVLAIIGFTVTGGTSGTAYMYLSATMTAGIPVHLVNSSNCDETIYYYDLLIDPGATHAGQLMRLMEGTATIIPSVTR